MAEAGAVEIDQMQPGRTGFSETARERDRVRTEIGDAGEIALLDLVAAVLGEAGQHSEDVGRPERSLVAADALTNLDDHVLAVGRIGLDEGELQVLLERG